MIPLNQERKNPAQTFAADAEGPEDECPAYGLQYPSNAIHAAKVSHPAAHAARVPPKSIPAATSPEEIAGPGGARMESQQPMEPSQPRRSRTAHPRVMHSLPTHHKNRLHCIYQPEAEPERDNPYPSGREGASLRALGVRVHIEIVFYGSTERSAMQRIARPVQ